MRVAYALLGLTFLAVLIASYILVEHVYAPTIPTIEELDTQDDTSSSSTNTSPMALTLTSTAFADGETIPSKYTCDGDNISPALMIGNVPEGTRSFALIVEDPDIPQVVKDRMGISVFDHWIYYGIPADTTQIPEGTVAGTNLRGEGYTGPCPPPEYEPKEHRYIFSLYALSGSPTFIKAPTKDELRTALEPLILETATLTGRYQRTISN